MTDWKGLCAEMLNGIELDVSREGIENPERFQALIDRARAELAQPGKEGPSDEELLRLADFLDSGSDVEAVVAFGRAAYNLALAQPEPQGLTDKELLGCMLKAAASVPGGQCTGILDWDKEAIAAARAVIAADRARWGRPAIEPVPTPEPGTADHITDDEGRRWDRTMDAALWAKAFCLICPEMTSREGLMIGWFANAIMAGCDHQAWKMDAEREPVPVGERLPGLEDCDTRGRCWFIDDDEKWCPVILGDILDEDEPDAIQRIICYYGYTHWVQGWALPVPTSQP